MKLFTLIACLFLLTTVSSVWSDTLVLKNGKQISGEIIEEDSQMVTLEMEYGKLTFSKDRLDGILRGVTKENFPQVTPTVIMNLKDLVVPTPLIFDNPDPEVVTEEDDYDGPEPFVFEFYTELENRKTYSISRRTPLILSRRKAGSGGFYANITKIYQFPPGSKIQILRSPIQSGDHFWYMVKATNKIDSSSARGWVSSRFLLDQSLIKEKSN